MRSRGPTTSVLSTVVAALLLLVASPVASGRLLSAPR